MYKVIIADDNPIVCKALESRIPWEELGLVLASMCKNGTEVMEAANRQVPDIVITDIKMPVMDGLAAICRLKSLPGPIQFIIITGYREYEFMKKAIEYEVVGYVMKPIQDAELRSCLEKAIQNRKNAEIVRELGSALTLLKRREELRIASESFRSGGFKDDERVRRHVRSIAPSCTLLHEWVLVPCPATAEYLRRTIDLDELMGLEDAIAGVCPGCGAFAFPAPHMLAILIFGPDAESLGKSERCALAGMKRIGGSPLSSVSERFCTEKRMDEAFADALRLLYEAVFDHRFSRPGGAPGVTLGVEETDTIRICLSLSDFRGAKELALKTVMAKLGLNPSPSQFDSCLFEIVDLFSEYSSFFGRAKGELSSAFSRALFFGSLRSIADFFTDGERYENGAEYSKVKSILDYVHKNCTNPLTLNDIGGKFHLTPLYLGQLLKSETKTSFRNYLNTLRIIKAKEILAVHSDITFADLAVQLGFSDEKYFSQVFKKITGHLPSAYRDGQSMEVIKRE
jgi:two-component system, response regulator YesN